MAEGIVNVITRYDKCDQLKDEISKFTEIINKEDIFKEVSILKSFIKYMLFFKRIQLLIEDRHYARCMIYDLLLSVYSLTQSSSKTFYYVYRSLIENYVRVLLDKSDNDATGVRNLFNELELQCTTFDSMQVKNYLEGEYGKCCNYVHSNINSNGNIYEYYQDILEKDVLTETVIKSNLRMLLTFMKQATSLIIELKPNLIDMAFYRKRQELKFLLNDSLYSKFVAEITK